MPEIRVFLDDDHRVVPEVEATRMVVRTTDAQGELVAEHWFHPSRPETPRASGILGALKGWLVSRP